MAAVLENHLKGRLPRAALRSGSLESPDLGGLGGRG